MIIYLLITIFLFSKRWLTFQQMVMQTRSTVVLPFNLVQQVCLIERCGTDLISNSVLIF